MPCCKYHNQIIPPPPPTSHKQILNKLVPMDGPRNATSRRLAEAWQAKEQSYWSKFQESYHEWNVILYKLCGWDGLGAQRRQLEQPGWSKRDHFNFILIWFSCRNVNQPRLFPTLWRWSGLRRRHHILQESFTVSPRINVHALIMLIFEDAFSFGKQVHALIFEYKKIFQETRHTLIFE